MIFILLVFPVSRGKHEKPYQETIDAGNKNQEMDYSYTDWIIQHPDIFYDNIQ